MFWHCFRWTLNLQQETRNPASADAVLGWFVEAVAVRLTDVWHVLTDVSIWTLLICWCSFQEVIHIFTKSITYPQYIASAARFFVMMPASTYCSMFPPFLRKTVIVICSVCLVSVSQWKQGLSNPDDTSWPNFISLSYETAGWNPCTHFWKKFPKNRCHYRMPFYLLVIFQQFK